MSLFRDRSPNPRPALKWKVGVFTVGAVMALIGIYFEERWLTGAALVALVAGALLRRSHSPMPQAHAVCERGGCLPTFVALLQKHLGYPTFRPGHEDLVRAVLAGRDARGVLPTGGGKSVCYQIPALVLVALQLTGAIRRLPEKASVADGTVAPDGGSHQVRVGIHSRTDLAWANDLLPSAIRKLYSVERYARG